MRNSDRLSQSGVSCPSSIEVPDMPLSYSLTGAKNIVTPTALIMPAIVSIRKLNGLKFKRLLSGFANIGHLPFFKYRKRAVRRC